MTSQGHDRPPYALYNPGMLPPETLLAEFTARKDLLEQLLELIRRNGEGEPQQHVIALGPRGMGKTTLLWAIAASIELREPDLKAEWQPVPFDEESRRIGDLADFWMECIRQWESATSPDRLRSVILDRLLDFGGDEMELEELAKNEFLKLVDASGKRALLLIDNLNELLAAIHDPEPLRRLRAFLMSDSRVMIVGAATQYFEAIKGLDKPFFEFFREFELKALTLGETMECLAGLAEVRSDEAVKETLRDRPKGVEALHVLTGGNPRLVRTFYRLLSEGMTNDLQQQLERLLDDYTPYQKAMIDVLPVQQQRILDAIALQWNPCEVSVVARETRLKSNQVSAQIKALVKSGMVSEVPGAGHQKKKAYMLTDRFSNIHYLMRHGRTGRLRMHWYVMTLRALFDDERYVESAYSFVKNAKVGDPFGDSVNLARSAISCAETEGAKLALWNKFAASDETDADVDLEIAERFLQEQLAENPDDVHLLLRWGLFLEVRKQQTKDAENVFRKIVELDKGNPNTWGCFGSFLLCNGRLGEAEKAFRKVIELDTKDSSGWFYLGECLHDIGKIEEAEEAYLKVVELEKKNSEAFYNLGNLFGDSGRTEEAEKAYREAIELDEEYFAAWNNLGILLSDDGRFEEAEKSYRRAIQLDDEYSKAWNNLGVLLSDNGRYEEAETAYRKGIELDPTFANPRAGLSLLLFQIGGPTNEAFEFVVEALKLQSLPIVRRVFQYIGADKSEPALTAVLPSLSRWCSTHKDDSESLTFTADMWVQLAKVASPAIALELFDSEEMTDETRLPFRIVEDAIRAAEEESHLHRLAPERLAAVLKYLEKLERSEVE